MKVTPLIKKNAGKPYAYMALIRDITDEITLKENLITARKDAEEASRAKSDFLANMSHEIRTPMNSIIGMAGLLMETSLDSEQRNYVEIFKNAGENLLHIINDILDVSKIESGNMELEYIDTSIERIIRNVTDIIDIKAKQKKLYFKTDVAKDVPHTVIADPYRLQQILINLCGNSLKFTKEGGIRLQVTIDGKNDDETVNILFSVIDTGIGMSKDAVKKIFHSFKQVDSSITRKFGGTGLGLSISKQLTEMMNGTIKVESEENEGSIFTCQIPLRISSMERITNNLTPIDLTGMHVLIVDDIEENLLILNKQLEKWGMTNTSFSDAQKTIDWIHDENKTEMSIDFILLDFWMPDISGLEVLNELRKSPQYRNIPVVFLTSDASDGHRKEAFSFGANELLIKPVSSARLKESITSLLHHQKKRQEKGGIKDEMMHLKMNILVVDDSPDNRNLISLYLKKTSITFSMAEDGEEAVEKNKAEHFDLILMDLQMPIMDGYTAIKTIRAWEEKNKKNRVPIIALSAYAFKEEVDKSFAAGANEHLTKPIKKKKLFTSILRYKNTMEDKQK